MKVSATIILVMFLFSCKDYKNFQSQETKEAIINFDKKWKKSIDELCTSLESKVGMDTNYSWSRRAEINDIHLSYMASDGTPEGFFYPGLVFSKEQAQFLLDTNIPNFYYLKQNGHFAFRVFSFRNQNEVMWLHVFRKLEATPIEKKGWNVIYHDQNRVYLVETLRW